MRDTKMKDIPVSLKQRCREVDDLIKKLRTASECKYECKNDRGIKFVCDFWNILKEDSNCDPTSPHKMKDVPDCLHQRYLELDEIIRKLCNSSSDCRNAYPDCICEFKHDHGIKLVCDFWNSFKKDPDCYLTLANETNDIPVCLNQGNCALNDLISNICATMSDHRNSHSDCKCGCTNDRGIKLIHNFWNILNEDPDNELMEAVKQRIALNTWESKSQQPVPPRSRMTCYMAGCSNIGGGKSGQLSEKKSCGCSRPAPEQIPTSASECQSATSQNVPLSTALCNLQKAASFEEKCTDKLKQLLRTEEKLKEAIQKLEAREKEGAKMVKQADCMWSCMEEAYQQKLSQSLERQKLLEEQLKEVEDSTKKWRKNMKDLESKIDKADKCQEEIKGKISRKNNDIKCIEIEIVDLQERLENNKKEIEATKKSIVTKKEASNKKLANIAEEIKTLGKVVVEEKKIKKEKELQGTTFIKEAREDLQKICGLLLKKKLENEDLKAERTALSSEIELLLQARDKCKDKCDLKQKLLETDIDKIDKEIIELQHKCMKCNQCTDTSDLLSLCSDCPRCLEERCCEVKEDHCSIDHTMDCICTTVKRKFLDNVFENMYTVLERQIKKGAGKTVADQVFDCLKRSRNGKLDERTRKRLQDFILSSVKKHLNLTIVGGAVKTRCELDPDMYNQLMICLQQVQLAKPEKVDKGTASKKDPCKRWGGTNECNCPKGPKACICLKKAPPPPHDPTPCPPDKEDMPDEENMKICPYKEKTTCGSDCGKEDKKFNEMMKVTAQSRYDSCKGSTCKFSKNMRTAPCVLDQKHSDTITTKECCSQSISNFRDQMYCDCSISEALPRGTQDTKQLKEVNDQNLYKKNVVIKKGDNASIANPINIDNYFIKLGKTASGASVFEVNKIFVSLVEGMNKVNPHSQIILKVTHSGHLLLVFSSDKYNVEVDTINTLENMSLGCMCSKRNHNVPKLRKQNNVKDSLGNSNVIGQCGSMHPPVTVLKQTASATVSIIATEPLDLFKRRITAISPETYTRIKVHHHNNIDEFPGVLKSTLSRNYILAIDKEYEKYFRNTVKNIKDNSTVILTLRKSDSGSHLVKFGCFDKENPPLTEIAILKKTQSGNIKIISNVSRDLSLLKSNNSESAEATKLAKYCMDLLRKLPKSQSCQFTVHERKHLSNKQISETQTSKKIGHIFRIQDNVRSPLLTRTPSPNSIVPLDAKSKTVFIDILKRYLMNPLKPLSVKTTTSDNMILSVRRSASKSSLLLKITRSNNIYVLPSEKTDKKNAVVENSLIDSQSELGMKNNTHLEHKLVGTKSCILSSDSCVSAKYNFKMFSNSQFSKLNQSEINESMEKYGKSESFPFIGSRDFPKLKKTLPHIIIKPPSKMCCIYHTDKTSSIDNKKEKETSQDDTLKVIVNNNTVWDSLSYLPPQLPSFLGDIIHRYN